jgi:hypothetical protein
MLITASPPAPPTPPGKPSRTRAKSSKVWRDLGFPTRTALEIAIRAITNPAPLGHPLPQDQQDFLVSVLKYHYQWEEKQGSGIDHLEIRINTNGTGNTRGIWIVRSDGSEEDISWRVPLSPDGRTTHLQDLKTAAREAIQDQMHAAHDTLPCERCELCGEPMTRYKDLHADHIHPFSEIFDDFFAGSENDIEVSNAGITTKIVNTEILQAWKDHHAHRAKLRLVHKACNLRRKKH